MIDPKRRIEEALAAFASQPLYDAGMGLLDTLGYRSDRTLRLSGLTAFRETLDQQGRLNEKAALTGEWTGVEFLQQITGEDVSASGQGTIPFETTYAPAEIQSYVFLAIELTREHYTRTELATLTRAVNRVFDMPALLLLKHGARLTLSIINRRLSKRDASKDVLEKVTLIKDIRYADPIRAHIEILNDLTVEALNDEFHFHTFLGLHQAWEKRLAS